MSKTAGVVKVSPFISEIMTFAADIMTAVSVDVTLGLKGLLSEET